jgi:hypothetical protein
MPPLSRPFPSILPFSKTKPTPLGWMSLRSHFRTRLDSSERGHFCAGPSPADSILVGEACGSFRTEG